jgi:hypothetical protein
MLQIYNGWRADEHHTVASGKWASWMTPRQAYSQVFFVPPWRRFALIAAFSPKKIQ